MRWILAGMLLLKLTDTLAATEHLAKIYQIDSGRSGESTLVLLTSGLVAKAPHDKELLRTLNSARRNQSWLAFRLTDKNEILSLSSIPAPFEEKRIRVAEEKEAPLYSPTVIPAYHQALAVFKNMNRRYNDKSQCYNRAHVWSWEMFQKHHIRSMKTFVFFSPKYIRRYNFEWWFHVAPFVYVNEGGVTVERVMDFRYNRKPETMRGWTDTFMHNNAECKDIQKYTEYEYTRSSADAPWCYVLRVPMYYYQPLDLESLDKQNKVRQFWEEWEVGNAYREAFSYRRGN